MSPEEDQQLSARARQVAVVIAATIVGWIGAQWLGKQLGLAGRYAFLFDLAALAALFWSLVVIFQIWRRRQQD